MASELSIALPPILVEDKYLVSLDERRYYLTYYLSTLNGWGAYGNSSVLVEEHNPVEGNLCTLFRLADVMHEELAPLLYLKLLTLDFNNCVHYVRLLLLLYSPVRWLPTIDELLTNLT